MIAILVFGVLAALTVAAASRRRGALPASVVLTATAVGCVPVAWTTGDPLLGAGLVPVAVISALLMASHVRAAWRARPAYPPVTRFRDDLTGYTITLETLNADEAGIVERLDGRYLRVVSVVPSVDHGFNRRAASATAQKLGAVLVDEQGRAVRPETVAGGAR